LIPKNFKEKANENGDVDGEHDEWQEGKNAKEDFS
jgi:hypothetical protein